MLTTRVVPREEWAVRFAGTDLGVALAVLKDQDMPDVIAFCVEDGETLIACWSLVRMWHAEGAWIAPDHRKNLGVGRHLLTAMREQAEGLGAPVILSASEDTDFYTQRLLEHLGATPMQLITYRWPILEKVET